MTKTLPKNLRCYKCGWLRLTHETRNVWRNLTAQELKADYHHFTVRRIKEVPCRESCKHQACGLARGVQLRGVRGDSWDGVPIGKKGAT